VPTKLKLTGKQETFTVQVLYDTLELYGKVNASQTIIVSPE
jgi:hypothetical protein